MAAGRIAGITIEIGGDTQTFELAGYRIILIMGMFRDKAIDCVVKTLVSDAKMIFTCQTPDNPRALRPIELADIVTEYNRNVTCCDSVEEAVEFASSMADDNTVIIATGSLAYLGRILDIYLK